MNSNDVKVVDISDVGQKIGDYVCPYCGVIMLPLSLAAYERDGLMLKFNVLVAVTSLILWKNRQNILLG